MTDRVIRVLLVDDHNVLRQGLRALLASEPGIEVVGEAATGRDAVHKARELAPDVVVMDIGMPELNGIDAARQIIAELFGTRVLCLSVHCEKQQVRAMLQAGADGYLLKTCARTEFVSAVRSVAAGRTYLSPDIAGDIVRHHVRGQGENRLCAFSVLSEREREVLQLIAEGHHTKDIADRLGISPKTVLAHRESAMRKIGVDSVVALTRYALREGIAEL